MKVIGLVLFFASQIFGSHNDKILQKQYEHACYINTPMHEHVPLLCELAKECSRVVEIGLFDMVSSWGIINGLVQNPSPKRSYLGIDIRKPSNKIFNLASTITKQKGIDFTFWHVNDMDVDIDEAELLFIDSLHTYCHLTYELEKFSSKISKYIALHDTSSIWETHDDTEYKGDYSEYPSSIDRNKKGLWPAVQDFLINHPEWDLHKRYYNSFGFTILKRRSF